MVEIALVGSSSETWSEVPALWLDPSFLVYRRRRRKLISYNFGDTWAGASRIDKSAVAQ